MKKKKGIPEVRWYEDEQDDFVGEKGDALEIPADFRYIRGGWLWRVGAFLVYRVVMTPFAYVFCKIAYGMKVVDERTEKPKKRQGCFLYGNHTLPVGDAFVPSLLMFPKKPYVVVDPRNLSAKGTRNFLMMLGALPKPQQLGAFKGFIAALTQRAKEGNCVTIYPEAHLWPYHTGIRNFAASSFRFPASTRLPVYVSTVTFQKRGFFRRPRSTVYLNGPYFADETLPPRQAEKELRDRVYRVMSENAVHSSYSHVIYMKKEVAEDASDPVCRQ